MKTLSSESQTELQELLTKILQDVSLDSETSAQLNYWAIELKPKRVRKKNVTNILDTEEGVIEQAYRDHTGGL